MVNRAILLAALLSAGAYAVELEADEFAELDIETSIAVAGISNCENKCQNVFNVQQYAINTQDFQDTYEYSACRVGCAICTKQIADSDKGGACFVTCKNTDWTKNVDINGNPFPITKGIVEPDKACMFGCVINTCQYVCTGGTTDSTVTPQNADMWWQGDASKGCSIKTGAIRPGGYYSQNSAYNYYNNPSGVGGADECCSNAYSLCNYPGGPDPSNQNYIDVLGMAQKYCKTVPGTGHTQVSICKYFSTPGNCGNALS